MDEPRKCTKRNGKKRTKTSVCASRHSESLLIKNFFFKRNKETKVALTVGLCRECVEQEEKQDDDDDDDEL